MASFVKYYCATEDLAEEVHNFASDTFKLALTNTAPTLTHTTLSQISELLAGNGYSAGGATITVSSSSQSSGLYKWICSDASITASGGDIGPARYAVLHNETANRLVGYWDAGAEFTITSGNAWSADFDATNGVIQVT